jgi:serine protease Do
VPRAALLWIALALAAAAAGGAQAAALDNSAQQQIRTATFEVVQRKPEESPAVSYDRPLPFELIPYQERIDKYRSIGTAFAIGSNRYVTAGHVISAGMGSQFGPPALRDAGGAVYDIDKVWKYSDHEDFVVFSLKSEPKDVHPLELGALPAVNDPVYAVGNALGEGIVIRDGVYTSDTPEELSGEWKWLRFSAAASPGNSGGPLIDQAGHVIGVVLRKSESENLNYALPIDRVRASADGEGRIDGRTPVRVALIDASETLDLHERITLPKTQPDFLSALQKVLLDSTLGAQRRLLEHNRERLFPNGASSEQILHSKLSAAFPRVLRENQDHIWGIGNEKPQTSQLDHNGFVETSNSLLRLRLPDDIGLGALYGDSKLYMDLLLKGYDIRRAVGSESVKVTSLGKAQWSSSYTDRYGRTWRLFAWAEPWSDTYLVAMSLPTPQGYVSFLLPVTSAFQQLLLEAQKMLADYVYVAFGGSLAQWRDFQAQKNVAPKVLSALKLEIDPDHFVRLHSRRCELEVTPELLPLSRDAMLWLNFTYFHDGDAVVWDLGGVSLAESTQKHNWVEVWRHQEPDASLPESFQSQWHKLQAREFPFNAMVSNANGSSRIDTAADLPAGAGDAAKIRYALILIREGDQTQEVMAPKLELLKHSFKALE